MQELMKAAVVHEFGKPLTIESVPIPVPGPGELLVKVMACGVCHTDLHAASGDWPVKPQPPFIPGHEGVGVIDELRHENHLLTNLDDAIAHARDHVSRERVAPAGR